VAFEILRGFWLTAKTPSSPRSKTKFPKSCQSILIIGSQTLVVEIRQLIDPAMNVQAVEQWSYVGNKTHQRWLWYAIDAATGAVLSFVLGPRKVAGFEKLYDHLKRFNIKTNYTDDWGSYSKYLLLKNTSLASKARRRSKITISALERELSGWRVRPSASQSWNCSMIP